MESGPSFLAVSFLVLFSEGLKADTCSGVLLADEGLCLGMQDYTRPASERFKRPIVEVFPLNLTCAQSLDGLA